MAVAAEPLTVTELTRRIKQVLELGFPQLSVQGEVSNLKHHSSGHVYFTLKDEGAQLSCVLWRSRAASMRFLPEDGLKIVAGGRLSVYEVRGSYQLDVQSIRPVGAGELQAAFERLKKKLAEEGLFKEARKRPLPRFPLRIGLITSPTGAVLHDMMNVFRRRFPSLEVILSAVRVQGAGASEEIARALDEFNEFGPPDVVILARGGGSLEDLWPFNEESVARAIARSRAPVVSAVGHETDFTIADFVADLRAPTPSAAAELVVPDRRELLENVSDSWYRMHQAVEDILRSQKERIRHLLESYAFNRPIDLLRQHSQRVDELNRAIHRVSAHVLSLTMARCEALARRLQALDPKLTLRRGYAIIRKEGRIVGSAKRLAPRDEIEVEFHDGTIESTIR
ncbi:MAG TPA: exodeoxyribonuclease VII large subunit [Bacteroidota bacterium]|nr:exodeoxyribonuclease VII large subunit [Bacteroidota bacterium]